MDDFRREKKKKVLAQIMREICGISRRKIF